MGHMVGKLRNDSKMAANLGKPSWITRFRKPQKTTKVSQKVIKRQRKTRKWYQNMKLTVTKLMFVHWNRNLLIFEKPAWRKKKSDKFLKKSRIFALFAPLSPPSPTKLKSVLLIFSSSVRLLWPHNYWYYFFFSQKKTPSTSNVMFQQIKEVLL